MVFTKNFCKRYDETNICHICECEIDKGSKKNYKVRNHCHLSGKFRGAAHSKCNLNYKIPKFYPVVFQNLSGYDSHLFIKKLGGDKGEDISCIPNNEEKYISFSKNNIVDKFVNNENKEILVKREL